MSFRDRIKRFGGRAKDKILQSFEAPSGSTAPNSSSPNSQGVSVTSPGLTPSIENFNAPGSLAAPPLDSFGTGQVSRPHVPSGDAHSPSNSTDGRAPRFPSPVSNNPVTSTSAGLVSEAPIEGANNLNLADISTSNAQVTRPASVNAVPEPSAGREPNPTQAQNTTPIFHSVPSLNPHAPNLLSNAVSSSPSTTKNSTAANWKNLDRFRRVIDGVSAGLGPLKPVMDELSRFVGVYEGAFEARREYAALKKELEEIFGILSTHFANAPPAMTASIENLCIAIEAELDRISTKEERGRGRRYIEASKDLDDIIECYRRIQAHVERLKLNADLSVWKIVDEQASETRLKSLAPSLSASYNSVEALQLGRRECTPETRKQVLAELSHWRHESTQENMYWLNGMAGTGKTTIANTLCAMLDGSHELGASFFCARLLPECRNVKLIFPTIAYQLARFSRPFYHVLSLALQGDPDLHTKVLVVQFEGLIWGPLRKVANALPAHLVIVIDALDECEDSRGVGLLLEILVTRASSLPIKIFVSSRPEPRIRQKIGETKSQLILHELESSIVKGDIRLYLQAELLGTIAGISDTNLSDLVAQAGVLFIYAATVVRYITMATSPLLQKKRLQAVLGMTSSSSSKKDRDIDLLYSTVLASAFDNPDLEDYEIANMKIVLDTVICAREPLPAAALAGLLGLEDTSLVQAALEPLWSVIHISGGEGVVTTLHASFPDYMLDPMRAKEYVCKSREHHGLLAERCFHRIHINEQQFNICGLESSYLYDNQVDKLEEKIHLAIPQDLLYACQYWAVHSGLAEPSTNIFQQIEAFLSNRLLLWMEVLNLKKQIGSGVLILEEVQALCNAKGGGVSQRLKDWVHDAWRFVTMFATNDVSRSTPHIYVSMLASWPSSGLLGDQYMQRTTGLTKIWGTAATRRQLALLGALDTGSAVNSVAFSPDGMRIVSGSDDNLVRIWDVSSGKQSIEALEGHTGEVNSVAFSPDGLYVASGSWDSTIRLWHSMSGKPIINPLQGHTDCVTSIAFSPDGLRIVSGSWDKTVRLWDAKRGQHAMAPLEGHTNWVTSVAFSPDGRYIASSSWDSTVRIWDVANNQLVMYLLEGHTNWITSVSFSPDGLYVVSGASDNTIRLWDTRSRTQVKGPLEGHNNPVNSVAFSYDGASLVSGSGDNIILMWDVSSGKPMTDPLKGHTGSVNSVAFSPSGGRIISASSDNTICVWDATSRNSGTGSLAGHTDWVLSVGFSPDGQRIISVSDDRTVRIWGATDGTALIDPIEWQASRFTSVALSPDNIHIVSGCDDGTIQIWDAIRGKPVAEPFQGHTDAVKSLAFSHDGTRIVSGSADSTIRIWDTSSRELAVQPLKGHTDSVNSVAFSPDSKHIVSGSNDHTVRLWDAASGEILGAPLTKHIRSVNSVAFSPDGMRVASGSSDCRVCLWDATSGELKMGPLNGHRLTVNSVSFSPDSRYIISASDDNTLRIWDVTSGKLAIDPLEGHTDRVTSAEFSPDGKRVVSGSGDNIIRMWDIHTLIGRFESCEQPSHIDPGSWTLGEHGWVVDYRHRPLLWLPPDLRHRILVPVHPFLISTEGSIRLNLEGVKLGDSWVEAYAPALRI